MTSLQIKSCEVPIFIGAISVGAFLNAQLANLVRDFKRFSLTLYSIGEKQYKSGDGHIDCGIPRSSLGGLYIIFHGGDGGAKLLPPQNFID